jgi:hypothetical protein
MTTTPLAVTRNLVVTVPDVDPMAGLTEEEKAKARKKIAKLLRKEHSIKRIVEANKTLLIGQGDADIIKTSPERKPAIRKEDNMRSPVNLYEYVKFRETHRLVITGQKDLVLFRKLLVWEQLLWFL